MDLSWVCPLSRLLGQCCWFDIVLTVVRIKRELLKIACGGVFELSSRQMGQPAWECLHMEKFSSQISYIVRAHLFRMYFVFIKFSKLTTYIQGMITIGHEVPYKINRLNPKPPRQLSLWEETGVPGENPRLSAERWPTLFTWGLGTSHIVGYTTENRTCDLRGERRVA